MIKIILGYNENDINKCVNIIKKKNDKLLEYPEIKTHPRELCRMIDKELLNLKTDNNLIIPTFSEVIVNRVGYLIAKHLLNYKDVVVAMIDDNNEKRIYEYAKDGYIVNWKIGFFSPDRIK